MGKGIVKLGEGNWAVKDGNLLAAKETNGRFKNAEFTVDRGTDATYVGRDGLIKDASFYNILPYSENFSHWTRTGNTTISATNITSPISSYNATNITGLDGSGGNDLRFFPSNFNSANKTLTLSVYLKGNGTLRMQMSNGVDQGSQDTITLSSNWTRHTLTATFNSTNSGNTFHVNIDDYNGATATFYDVWGAQLVEGTEALDYQYTNGKEGIPRIDFTDNTDGHLLLEPESRNLFDYSEDFSTSNWIKNGIDIDYGHQSPTGLNTATKIAATSTDPYLYKAVNVTQNQTYTFSFYCKGEGSSVGKTARVLFWYGLGTAAGSMVSHEFNLTSGWERIQFQTTPTGSGTLDFRIDIPANSSEIGDVAYLWGAQTEELPYATSYIPTNGSTVTRDGETCTGAGETADFNSSEGVLYVEIAALAEESESKRITISDGSLTNRITLSVAGNIISGFINVNNVTQYTFFESGQNITSFNKIAVKYKANDFALWINGVEYDIITSGSIFSANTLNVINFANATITDNDFYGKVKAIRVYKETDGIDLATLTSQ